MPKLTILVDLLTTTGAIDTENPVNPTTFLVNSGNRLIYPVTTSIPVGLTITPRMMNIS